MAITAVELSLVDDIFVVILYLCSEPEDVPTAAAMRGTTAAEPSLAF
jgi:hypothetical protein